MPGLHRFLIFFSIRVFLNVSEYVWICMNNCIIYLNISQDAWIRWNMHEYTYICLNGFCFTFRYCNPLSILTCSYLLQRLYETRSYSLKEHVAVFLKRQNLVFSIVTGNIWFVSFFRLNIFTSNISNLLLFLEVLAYAVFDSRQTTKNMNEDTVFSYSMRTLVV